MKPTSELPEDAALPALDVIRSLGLAGAIPALGLQNCPVELLLRRYHRGVRAVFEARVRDRRLAVKVYAEDPSPEARLHEALAGAGLANDSGFRVPPLLACDRELRLLVTGWLEGLTAEQLVESGQGKAAGELVARWFQRTASTTVKLGPSLDSAGMLRHVRKWVATLATTDSALGTTTAAVLETLERTKPKDGASRLVHGSFYPRHVIDLGDGVGVFDWERFGQDQGSSMQASSSLRPAESVCPTSPWPARRRVQQRRSWQGPHASWTSAQRRGTARPHSCASPISGLAGRATIRCWGNRCWLRRRGSPSPRVERGGASIRAGQRIDGDAASAHLVCQGRTKLRRVGSGFPPPVRAAPRCAVASPARGRETGSGFAGKAPPPCTTRRDQMADRPRPSHNL